MAATWRATQGAVAFASGKDMINVFNSSSSAKTINVYRAYHFNNGTGAVTGVLTTMQARRITTATGGTTFAPVAHNTASAALDANTTAGTNQSVTGGSVFRRYVWSNDEPAVSGATLDEWELLVPFAEVFMAGYGDSNIEPIVSRAGQNEGFELVQTGTSAVGSNDFEIEFTNT